MTKVELIAAIAEKTEPSKSLLHGFLLSKQEKA